MTAQRSATLCPRDATGAPIPSLLGHDPREYWLRCIKAVVNASTVTAKISCRNRTCATYLTMRELQLAVSRSSPLGSAQKYPYIDDALHALWTSFCRPGREIESSNRSP
ncbi:hypothetical protein A0H81_09879 [Grifola frondosa]|uniref:Uncharacterized protein n=1 Tax=Grifola frondosa TaxID=5627 RepID=A0A1C7LZ71_GRIFR|nr:hypothetical protein A0H81_09879 [Grifola frondosa]